MTISIGTYQQQPQGYKAFIPLPFPPNEGLSFSPSLDKKHAEAIRLVGKLDGITKHLPDKDFFLLMFVRKDASSSSQIEGTRATLMDAIEADSKERPARLPRDVDDILHYINAVNYGLDRTKSLPLSLRLVQELHEKLMVGARSTQHPYPGEFRRSQNWIGGTSPSNAHFVPPPTQEVSRSLGDLENFLHADDQFLPLIKAGLIHAQFETIHPFTDGNGRTGRILITMYLWNSKLLEVPVLYLSSYFKKHQQEYYNRLQGYHSDPAQVTEWLDFFLGGIIETAKSAISTCEKITDLRERDMRKAQQLGKPSAQVAVDVIRNLYGQPNVGVSDIVAWTGYTRPGAYKVIDRLVNMGILKPINESATYGKRYIYDEYFKLFEEE